MCVTLVRHATDLCVTMKKPFCKLCATYHYSHEPHNFPATDEAPAEEVAVVEKRRVDDAPKMSREVITEKVKRGEISDRVAGVALTVAERSKTYRLNKGAEYRRRNRERMARIRGSPSPEE